MRSCARDKGLVYNILKGYLDKQVFGMVCIGVILPWTRGLPRSLPALLFCDIWVLNGLVSTLKTFLMDLGGMAVPYLLLKSKGEENEPSSLFLCQC